MTGVYHYESIASMPHASRWVCAAMENVWRGTTRGLQRTQGYLIFIQEEGKLQKKMEGMGRDAVMWKSDLPT